MIFEDKIAAMVPRYLARTATRVSEACDALANAEPGALPEVIAGVRILLHDLAGTAPVMGLADIGSLARRGDDLALSLRNGAMPADATELAQLRAVVQNLSEEVLRVRDA